MKTDILAELMRVTIEGSKLKLFLVFVARQIQTGKLGTML